MNRKFEDKLVELAFGDMSPDDAKRLEARAASDPEAAKALRSYREMRGGLRTLVDVPEHQLSNERLRDAILGRGLQQEPMKPASSSRGWLWVPVAACALGFTFMLMKNRPGPAGDAQLVGFDSAASRVAKIDLTEPRNFVPIPVPASRTSSTTVAGKSLVSTPVHGLVDRAPVRVAMNEASSEHRRHFTGSWRRGNRLASASPKGTIVIPAPPLGNDSLSATNSNEAALETKADNMSKDQPIVLIATDKDAGTGTQVATEVQSASNVLVGG